MIKDAILGNDFLKNLDSTQVREIVDCMYEKRIKQGNYIIREGDAGQHVYVSAGKYPDVNRHRCKNALTIVPQNRNIIKLVTNTRYLL